MNPSLTLKEIFDSNRVELSNKLSGMTLPRNSIEIQEIVAIHINSYFENNGVYRQSLTQSEDYILQSAVQLLRAQNDISSEIIKTTKPSNEVEQTKNESSPLLNIAGAGIGSLAGSLV